MTLWTGADFDEVLISLTYLDSTVLAVLLD
jgi:hypothetical protein